MAVKEVEVQDIVQVVTVKVIETIKGRPRVLPNARVTLQPVFDRAKGGVTLKTGISRKDWELKYKDRWGDFDKFYADFKIVLSGATRQFDPTDPYNEIVIALLKNHPFVAKDNNSITKDTRFVLYDEVEEAKLENVAFESTLKAYKYLFEMSQAEKTQFLKLYGFKNTESVSPEVVAKKLKNEAEKDSKKFVELFEDKAKDLKILINDLLSNSIIRKVGGVIYFGSSSEGIPMGSSIEQAVEFLKDPKHGDLLKQLSKLLTELKKGL